MNQKSSNLISVLIPVYNVEKYVFEAVTSIINQSVFNLEIIIIDDCSTDNTYGIVKEIADRDKRIVLLRNSTNQKIVYCLNLAFKVSQGDFIARMDGDDVSLPGRLERKLKFLLENPEYSLVGCSTTTIDTEGREVGASRSQNDQRILDNTLKYVSPIKHIWLARRSVYEKLNGYRAIPSVEDYDFLLRMKSSKLQFTNLSDYFGYKVRIGISGNTIDTFGIRQLQFKKYAYNLYMQRVKFGRDKFSELDCKKVMDINLFYQTLYNFSSRNLVEAIFCKNRKSYFKMSIYFFLSLWSPHQLSYLYERFMLRFLTYTSSRGYK
jgi:glycosyltransferase involved in cell wall biosynthesis